MIVFHVAWIFKAQEVQAFFGAWWDWQVFFVTTELWLLYEWLRVVAPLNLMELVVFCRKVPVKLDPP